MPKPKIGQHVTVIEGVRIDYAEYAGTPTEWFNHDMVGEVIYNDIVPVWGKQPYLIMLGFGGYRVLNGRKYYSKTVTITPDNWITAGNQPVSNGLINFPHYFGWKEYDLRY